MSNFSIRNNFRWIISVICGLILWNVLSMIYLEYVIPSPEATIKALLSLIASGQLFYFARITIGRAMAGFSLSFFIGGSMGLIMGLNDKVHDFLRPWVTFLQVSPTISWLLIAMIWFGLGDGVAVFIIFIATFPVMIINTIEGVRQVDPNLVQMAQTFEVPRSCLIREIYIPSILPYIMAGASIIMGMTWKAVAMAEVLGATTGIGAGMSWGRVNLETPEVFAWTLLLVTLGFVSEWLLIRPLQAKFSWWK